MQPEFWYLSMKEIMDAFLQREFKKSIELIRAFLALFSLEWCKNNQLNETQFNDLLDTALLLRGLGQLGTIEYNHYYQNTIERFEIAVKTYTQPREGKPEELHAAIESLKLLCDGIWVGACYLEEKELRLDHSPIMLSFELKEEGIIKLFGWTDSPEYGTPEHEEEQAAIAELKADFERLFAQRKANKADVLTQARQLIAQQAHQEALQLLQKAIKKDSSIQKEAFLLQADIYQQLNQPSQLIDSLMKCLVLGLPKSAIRARVRAACDEILQSPHIQSDPEQLKRWQEFRADF